jgi:diguanylate cyclase (GGDEF)-like protein/PAS domain S-box-containing protein
MSSRTQNDLRSQPPSFRLQGAALHRCRSLRVLFIHRDAQVVDDCLQELKKARFIVSSDVVLNLAQCTQQLRSQSYDVVVAEYPSPSWKGPQALQLLQQTVAETPLLFVTTGPGGQSLAQLIAAGSVDHVQLDHVAHLPVAIRRVLSERKLRQELEEARKALRHSQSLYRALVDNPAYGIYRCDPDGKFLDVNQALLTMLGYETMQELIAADRASEIALDSGDGKPSVGSLPEPARMEPIETQWVRKNGTILKVRLSGRAVYDDHGNFSGREIIAIDVTEQRTLEEQLRHQASSDSLTGLANHRRLFEVLHSEICRSKRTGREFSLVLLDLDNLKQVNDQFSHLVGDRALCRLGQILTDSCRSIDTAARHGGDEFALVLPETSVAAATLVAQRICELLEAQTEAPPLSVSAGIASFPEDADTIGTLLYAADAALYAMKDSRPTAVVRAGHRFGSLLARLSSAGRG